MIWVRSLLFNVTLFTVTAVMCFLLMWTLVLPRRYMLAVVYLWLYQIVWIERVIAGIKYKVVGRDYVPNGSCIIASKHQSAWETFKLHLLFGDPAIVLKKELLRIPIWGWYLGRAGMIPIDRSAQGRAVSGMMAAAHKAVEENRKIVIFPQGTRTAPGEEKPYKNGVFYLYQDLGLPVVPMALNSGLLWGKRSFIKRPGTITVEFLAPIEPGMPREAMIERLRRELEAASNRLLESSPQGR